MTTDTKRNIRRRKHYHMLKLAGYDREIATKLKDHKYEVVVKLCSLKRDAMKSVDAIDGKVQSEMERIMGKSK